MDGARRAIVLQAIQGVCEFKGWQLNAVHVRTTHVHVIVDTEQRPELVMNSFKAYASRALTAAGLDARENRRWSRHGSTRYLWTRDDIEAAVAYVVDGQGAPMAVYVNNAATSEIRSTTSLH